MYETTVVNSIAHLSFATCEGWQVDIGSYEHTQISQSMYHEIPESIYAANLLVYLQLGNLLR